MSSFFMPSSNTSAPVAPAGGGNHGSLQESETEEVQGLLLDVRLQGP
jgi:hypothetical protein